MFLVLEDPNRDIVMEFFEYLWSRKGRYELIATILGIKYQILACYVKDSNEILTDVEVAKILNLKPGVVKTYRLLGVKYLIRYIEKQENDIFVI